MTIKNGMRPVHPGEVLREDYLRPLHMKPNALAMTLRVPAPRINDIVLERRAVTPDTAMRLARYFGGDPRAGSTFRWRTTCAWPRSRPRRRSSGK
nr:HigA family addiction module antitoxin [Algiphilus aromaticivorans]